MTIEENSNQLRQIMILIDDGFKMIKAMAGKPLVESVVTTHISAEDMSHDVVHINTPSSTAGVGASGDTAAPTITTDDFGELDAMGCPFDPSIMGTNRTKNRTGKLKDCWKKKKDASYTEEMYMNDRRKLIASVEAAGPSTPSTEETTSDAPPPPAIADNTAPPPPIAPATVEDISELPSIPDFDTVTSEQFIELCRAFILKHGDEGARQVAENMKKCGFAPGTTPDQVNQQDQLTWITKRIIDHDATHA